MPMRLLQKLFFSSVLLCSSVSLAEGQGRISHNNDNFGQTESTNGALSPIGQFRRETRDLPASLSIAEKVDLYAFGATVGTSMFEISRRLQYVSDHFFGETSDDSSYYIRLVKISYLQKTPIEKTMSIFHDLLKKQEPNVSTKKRTLKLATETAIELTSLAIEWPSASVDEHLNQFYSVENAVDLSPVDAVGLLRTALRWRKKPSALMARLHLTRLSKYSDAESIRFISLTGASENFKVDLDCLDLIRSSTRTSYELSLHLFETQKYYKAQGVAAAFNRITEENREVRHQAAATILRLAGTKKVSDKDVLMRFKLALQRNPGGWESAIALTEASYSLQGNRLPELKDAFDVAFFNRRTGSTLSEPTTLAVLAVTDNLKIKDLVDSTNALYPHTDKNYALATTAVASAKIRERRGRIPALIGKLDFAASAPLFRALIPLQGPALNPANSDLLSQGEGTTTAR